MKASFSNDVSELRDLLSYMVLFAPSMQMTDLSGRNVDTVFRDLDVALAKVKEGLGILAYSRLKAAAAEAKELCQAGDDGIAPVLLQHMDEYLRLKKYRTDEPVVDESRFQ